MSTSNKSDGQSGPMQFIIPALLGAATAAAGIAAFLYFDVKRTATPSSEPQPVASQSAVGDTQKAEIEKIVEDYLLNNPQILIRMSEALEEQQSQERVSRVQDAIAKHASLIYKQTENMVAGNPDGDVTVVEFSDYNCPYCKRAFTNLRKLIEKDKNVRLVMKEFPIFGERSEGAARVAIAAAKQGKYFEMHAALLENRGQNNEQVALGLAEKLGLDMDKLRADSKSEEVAKIISETRELGNTLGIQGTPFFLVGDKAVPGAPEDLLQVFETNVAEIRKNGCTVGC